MFIDSVLFLFSSCLSQECCGVYRAIPTPTPPLVRIGSTLLLATMHPDNTTPARAQAWSREQLAELCSSRLPRLPSPPSPFSLNAPNKIVTLLFQNRYFHALQARSATAYPVCDRPFKTRTATKSSRKRHTLTLSKRSACLCFACRPFQQEACLPQPTKNSSEQCLR